MAAPPFPDVLSMIGNTPMVEVTRLDLGPCRLFLKLEQQNPGGSIKDRIALSMIAAAERDGRLKPGGTIVEATAGNTGIGLALVAAVKGYQLRLVIPDKMSREKIFHLKAMGAEVVMTRSDVGKGHPAYYQDLAARLAAESGGFYVDQFNNPANPLAHETGTGPEITAQMEGRVDAVVCGVGSSGTLTGLSRHFARVSPDTEMVLADPEGSVLHDIITAGRMGEAGSWLVEGIGEDFVPAIADLSRVRKSYRIPDAESFEAARELLRREGLLGGSSSGTLLAAALHYCREQTEPKRVVTFVVDSGNKYLSKMYNDWWLADQGLLGRADAGDLRDLIARPHAEGGSVTAAPDDTLMTALGRMKMADVSQLPVMENERVVGLVDEWDLLHAVHADPVRFHEPVATWMSRDLETLSPDAPLAALKDVFDRGRVVLLVENGRYLGLVTRIDLLNHLRRQMD